MRVDKFEEFMPCKTGVDSPVRGQAVSSEPFNSGTSEVFRYAAKLVHESLSDAAAILKNGNTAVSTLVKKGAPLQL